MPRDRSVLRQLDIMRALRAADAAGSKVSRVEIDREGKIVLVMIEPPDEEQSKSAPSVPVLL